MSAAAELLLELLACPSPQSDLAAVRACVRDVVRPRLAAVPWDSLTIDAAGNAIACLDGPEPVLLLTYAATYPAATMPCPYPGRRLPGGLLRGRGAAEQRSGLAAALWAVARFAAAGQARRRGLIFATCIAGEMGSHDVVAELLDGLAQPPAAGLIAVATGNAVCLGNKGRVDVHVRIHGRACHSADPESGLNAVDGAMAYLSRLAAGSAGLPSDPELGRATLVVTAIESEPRTAHTVPALCRLTLDRRLLAGEDAAAACAALPGELPPWRVEVEAGRVNLPNKVAAGEPVAAALFAASAAAGLPAAPFYRKSALDAGLLTARGAPCVMFGPGEQRFAHTDQEVVAESDVEAAARVYLGFLERFCL